MTPQTPLTNAFFARRDELRRYLVARVGDVDADDLLQEAYLRVVSLPADADVRNAGAFLYRLCANVMLDRLRQQRARQVRDDQWCSTTTTTAGNGESLDDTIAADRTLIARDRLRRLQVALENLPVSTREAFRLHKFEGLSHGEVAARLGVSKSMIEKHMMRAMKSLSRVEE